MNIKRFVSGCHLYKSGNNEKDKSYFVLIELQDKTIRMVLYNPYYNTGHISTKSHLCGTTYKSHLEYWNTIKVWDYIGNPLNKSQLKYMFEQLKSLPDPTNKDAWFKFSGKLIK